MHAGCSDTAPEIVSQTISTSSADVINVTDVDAGGDPVVEDEPSGIEILPALRQQLGPDISRPMVSCGWQSPIDPRTIARKGDWHVFVARLTAERVTLESQQPSTFIVDGREVQGWYGYTLAPSSEWVTEDDDRFSITIPDVREIHGLEFRWSVNESPQGEPLTRTVAPMSMLPFEPSNLGQEYLVVMNNAEPMPGRRLIVAAYRLQEGRFIDLPPGARVNQTIAEYVAGR
jgi:hypothetical protein